jgi:ketosteroid isomerase-like protein
MIKISAFICCLVFASLGGSGAAPAHGDDAGSRPLRSEGVLPAEDERAISAVLVRYATAIDRRDWPLFATCFTDDVVTDYGDIGKWTALKPFADYMEKGHLKVGPTMHKLSNFVITGRGDHAAATSYIDALLLPLAPGGSIRRAEGRYEDQLVRVKGEWKISNRRFVSVRIADIPAGN